MRRRYQQQAERLLDPDRKKGRRQNPAAIECFGATDDGPIVVHLSNEKYEFNEDARGRLVAHVYVEDHIACFLARADMYRLMRTSP